MHSQKFTLILVTVHFLDFGHNNISLIFIYRSPICTIGPARTLGWGEYRVRQTVRILSTVYSRNNYEYLFSNLKLNYLWISWDEDVNACPVTLLLFAYSPKKKLHVT